MYALELTVYARIAPICVFAVISRSVADWTTSGYEEAFSPGEKGRKDSARVFFIETEPINQVDGSNITFFKLSKCLPFGTSFYGTGVRWIVVDRNLFDVAGGSRIWALIKGSVGGGREREGFFTGQNYRELATYRSIRRGGTERSFNESLENA